MPHLTDIGLSDLINPNSSQPPDSEIISFLRLIINSIPVPLAINDRKGQITFINEAFIRILGYTKHDIPTLDHWWPLAYPDAEYRQWVLDTRQKRILEAEQSKTALKPTEVRIHCKDDVTRTFLVSGCLIRDILTDSNLMIFYDITDHAQIQENIRILYRDFVAFLENTKDYVYYKDQENRFRFCSQSLAEISGCQNWQEMIGKHLFECYPEDIATSYYESELPTLTEGIPLIDRLEPFVDKSGYRGWVKTSKWPQYDVRGNIVGIFGISRDVTDFIKVQEQLETSEKRYRTVLEDQSEIICRFKADGTILYVNEAYCRFFAKSRDELIGHTWHPVAYADDIPAIEEKLSSLSPDKPVVIIENRVIDATHELRWCQFINRAFFDDAGALVEMQAVGRDITEQKQNERLLIESQAMFATLFYQNPVGIALSRLDSGEFIDVNDAFADIHGYARHEIIGHSSSELGLWESPEFRNQVMSIVMTQGKILNQDIQIKRKSGEIRDVLASLHQVAYSDLFEHRFWPNLNT